MSQHATYFDAILFGRLLLAALVVVDRDLRYIDAAPARLSSLISQRTGLIVDPQRAQAIIDGDSKSGCDVALFRAIVETLEPHGGAHWFDPAFDPASARNFWRVNMEREVL